MWSLLCEETFFLWRICESLYSREEAGSVERKCPTGDNFWEGVVRSLKSWRSHWKEWNTPSGAAKPVISWLFIIFLLDHVILGCLSDYRSIVIVVWKPHTFSFDDFITTKWLHTPLWVETSWTYETVSNSVQWDLFPSTCHANLTKLWTHLKNMQNRGCITQ